MEKSKNIIYQQNLLVGFNVSSLTKGIISLKNNEECILITEKDIFKFLKVNNNIVISENDKNILETLDINTRLIKLNNFNFNIKKYSEANVKTDSLYVVNKSELLGDMLDKYVSLGGELLENSEVTGIYESTVEINEVHDIEYGNLYITRPNSSIKPYINMGIRQVSYEDTLRFFITVKNDKNISPMYKIYIKDLLEYDTIVCNKDYITISVVTSIKNNPLWHVYTDKLLNKIEMRFKYVLNNCDYINKEEFNRELKDLLMKIGLLRREYSEINLMEDKLCDCFELLSYSEQLAVNIAGFYDNSYIFGGRFGASNPLIGYSVGSEILSAYHTGEDTNLYKSLEELPYKERLNSLHSLYEFIFNSILSNLAIRYIYNNIKFTEYVINNMILNSKYQDFSLSNFYKCRKEFKKEIINGKQ